MKKSGNGPKGQDGSVAKGFGYEIPMPKAGSGQGDAQKSGGFSKGNLKAVNSIPSK